jgi:hypothetical protein
VDSRSAHLVATRYTRGTAVAVVVIVASWHSLNDLGATVASWSGYRWPPVVAAAWLVFAALAGFAARALLIRGGELRRPWFAAGLLLALAAAVDLASSPVQVLTTSNWGWGAIGWVALILFWRTGVRDLVTFLAANAVIALAVLIVDDQLTRGSLARYLMIVTGTGALQLGLAGTVVALRAAATWTAQASTAHAVTVTARAAAQEAHLIRRRRYEALRRDTGEVLTELAYADGDPADPALQHRCAAAAARLRRLVVETDDVPDPLVHELRACADIAERKGVIVELVTAGRVPWLPVRVRRALTEPPIGVLATAKTRARITVVAGTDQVTVSVIADTELDHIDGGGGREVSVHIDRDGARLWVETAVRLPVDPR